MAGTDLYPVAGLKIYIGGTKATQVADFVAADFSAVTWVEIDGWSQMGAIGDAAQTITTSLINRGRDVKQKGTRNAGSMQNVFAKIAADAGQLALIAAEKTSSNYAFKIEFDDAATSPAMYDVLRRNGKCQVRPYHVGCSMSTSESARIEPMMFANLLRICAERSTMPLPAWTGVVFVKMHKFMRHGPNQRVSMADRG